MAHKTFISYKYSESQELRDKIIKRLGPDSRFYQGETSESPDLTSYTNETIKASLKDMIFNTSVLIVIVSPHMKESKWMEWEIKYALREQTRNDYTSHPNGIICVISEDPIFRHLNSSFYPKYDWAYDYNNHLRKECLFDIIIKNTNNLARKELYRFMDDDYIVFVKEEDFLLDPNKYIEKAYNRSILYKYYDIHKE